jgi:amino acid transporter
MAEKSKKQRKPYFFMWIVIGIGVGAMIGGGIFGSFVLGAGLGVGLGVALGLWSEYLARKMNKDRKDQ